MCCNPRIPFALSYYLLHNYCFWEYYSGNLKTLFQLVMEILMIIVKDAITPAKTWCRRLNPGVWVKQLHLCWLSENIHSAGASSSSSSSTALFFFFFGVRTRKLQNSPIGPRRFLLSSHDISLKVLHEPWNPFLGCRMWTRSTDSKQEFSC